jgi:dCMP deaminase
LNDQKSDQLCYASNRKAEKYDKLYMDIAFRCSEMSWADRLKVGSIAVLDGRIISMGWNGMPAGMPNVCEDDSGNTKSEVMHAEENMILKLTRHGESAVGATLYNTHSPCMHCAKMIYGAGFKEVVFAKLYRTTEGIDFLRSLGVTVTHYGTSFENALHTFSEKI